ncbi:MFS transporter [Mycobacterium sp. M1]|uniref:MFS transporter n=1 Tax=Mycolicibacter acidiphilus TaxID=2835306 RepID=A0ABS5RJZ4_9MYCO|nr:MFS transporter [Mycolicibacter acidiphilus]MBS9533254.1 MFS transporter [Mycolicibacter acidiphilus]
MTAETRNTSQGPRQTRSPWTPRVAVQLTVLAAAAFIYVTAETVPVGALTAIALGLDVSEALVGTLLAWYAVIAAVTTIPLVRWTARWPRRETLLLTLLCLTVSQVISAVAPNFWVLAGARVLCAITHGLMWSVIAPIAARLVPASHAGRATTVIYLGTSLALVLGNPLVTAMSLMWGWRVAVAVVAVASAAVTAAAWSVLPRLTLSAEQLAGVGRQAKHHRNGRLLSLSGLTLTAVAGHFISYTFILVIIRDVVGVDGPDQAWFLAAFGIAGLVAVPLVARPLDRRPKLAVLTCMALLTAAFLLLTGLALNGRPSVATTVAGTVAIVLWGAMSMAVSPVLQSAAMRSAPEDPDGASGLYVAAFQVGIMAGSLLGGLLYDRAGVPAMLAASAVLISGVLAGMAATRGVFVVSSPVDDRNVRHSDDG